MDIRSLEVRVSEEALDDLRERLARTRWPDEVEGAGWDYGTNLAYLRELVGYWQGSFDWREQEEGLNRFAHFHATVDGFGVHFIHERGRGDDPMPLILTHGWPSTFFEFSKIIRLLTDPESHGEEVTDSFDVVVPSLPGYGFFDRPKEPGFSRHIPRLWIRLMEELGYPRFAAHGVDVGASVTNLLGLWYPDRLVGIHITYPAEPYVGPGAPGLSERERLLPSLALASSYLDHNTSVRDGNAHLAMPVRFKSVLQPGWYGMVCGGIDDAAIPRISAGTSNRRTS